jgi:hypothetical protein
MVVQMSRFARRSASAVLVSLVLLGTGCGGDGLPGFGPGGSTLPGEVPDETPPVGTDAPDPEPEPEPEPEPDPPVTDAPEVEPPETEEPDDGDGGTDWAPIVAILLGLGVVAAIISAVTKRRPSSTPAAAPHDPRRQLVSTIRWIHDQFSLEVLALPPIDSQQRWHAERSRFDQLAIDLRVQAAQADPEVWNNLSAAVTQLASSLDTALRVRSTEGVDEQLAREAVATANRHRAELQAWLVAAERTI